MRIRIHHATHYRFDRPVPYGLQRLRLMPKATHEQRVIDWDMTVEGGYREAEYDDQHLNHVVLVKVAEGATEVVIRCDGVVETQAGRHGIVGSHQGPAPLWLFQRHTPRTLPGPAITSIVDEIRDRSADDDIDRLHALSAIIADRVSYMVGATDATTSGEEAAVAGKGVCQDHAHIMLAAARELGHPARYVSGYLASSDDGVRHEASHAWAEVAIDHVGWIGFDVSNGISPDERYVRVATGRDYVDAAPLTAVSYGARDTEMHVSVEVERVAVRDEEGSEETS
ncbi:MAG: transglutaminase family protein [Thermoleophilia bacterium]